MMAQENKSYIKENLPNTYAFFLEYWEYLKNFYVMVNTDDWWSCFMSDLNYYVTTYADNDFFVELIMALYVRNNDYYEQHDIKYLSDFYKDWWALFNAYYKPLKIDKADPIDYIGDLQKLYDKYDKDMFFRECIDILNRYLMPEIKTQDSTKFVKDIYDFKC